MTVVCATCSCNARFFHSFLLLNLCQENGYQLIIGWYLRWLEILAEFCSGLLLVGAIMVFEKVE